MEKQNNIVKIGHIMVIILGSIFVFLSIFHTNIWFDESYSVGLAQHSFSEIWTIGGKDVHPILYYVCLHILYLIFGNNIFIYRIFSALCILLLAVIGYTHIRKDFGERVGFFFSFFTLFLPFSSSYAGEIRMYSLGMLLGTLMAIYAYRIYQKKLTKTTFLCFGLSSLALAYTHYYGLMFAGIVNVLLFIYLVKNRKEQKKELRYFLITAVIQVFAYIPWLVYFLVQIKQVSQGFWISLSFPGTLIDVLTIQFMGNLPSNLSLVVCLIFYSYLFFIARKQTKLERKPLNYCLLIYLAIILIVLAIYLLLEVAILLNRYLIICTGLLIFVFAFLVAKDKNKHRTFLVCAIFLFLSYSSNFVNIQDNYNQSNKEVFTYLEEEIEAGDILVYNNPINGAVITTKLPKNLPITSYFYNKDNWRGTRSLSSF